MRNPLLVFLVLFPFGSFADEPSPSPSPSPTPAIEATPESTYMWQKAGVRSDLQEEWNKLSQGIARLQRAMDELAEEVGMFSQQLADEINEEAKRNQPQPTPKSTPEPTPTPAE